MLYKNASFNFNTLLTKVIGSALLLPLAFAFPVKAEETVAMPVLFDSKERISGADLSGFARIRFLMSVDFPPFNFTDQESRLSGVHVDLVREICAALKIEGKCQIQALPFDELEGALELGEGEVVVSGIAPTAELRRSYSFSRPFFRMPARFATRKGENLPGDAGEALKGKAVGVIEASRHEQMLRAFFPSSEVVTVKTRDDLYGALKDGKVTAIFADGLRLPFWVNGSQSADCCQLFDEPYFSDQFLGEGFTIMAVDQNNLLIPAFDQALSTLSSNGKLEEIYRRYFPHGFY